MILYFLRWLTKLKLLIFCWMYSFLLSLWNVVTENNSEPVNNLNKWDDAKSKAEAKAPSKVGDEIHHGHPLGLLILWVRWMIIYVDYLSRSWDFTLYSWNPKIKVQHCNVFFQGIVGKLILLIEIYAFSLVFSTLVIHSEFILKS